MASSAKPRASLLWLPPEIRIKTYEYVVINPFKLKSPYYLDSKGEIILGHYANLHDTFAVLKTCRELYEDALPTFYGRNVFTYRSFNYMEGFPRCHLDLVKRLYLRYLIHYYDEESWITAFVRYFDRHCPALRTLTLQISRHTSIGIPEELAGTEQMLD